MDSLSNLPPFVAESGKASFDLQVKNFLFHLTFTGSNEDHPDAMKNIEEILQNSYSL